MRRTLACSAVGIVLLAFVLTDAARAVDPKVLAAQKQRVEVVAKAAPTVLAIFSPGGTGGGSGVIISKDGYALTNFHVTRGAGTFMQCGLSDGKVYFAVIVGVDPTGDVALIKVLGRNDFPAAKLGDSDKLRAGDFAYAMGNPFLLATDFKPTVTYGVVSGVHRYQYPAGKDFLEYTDCIQIDTSINPGNSGGPLFNSDGELVGINGRGSFEKRGRVNSGAGYAISINQIKNFMGHLKSGRIVDHATLGATVETSRSGAVIVSNILEESEAFRRGLEIGDEIVFFAGRPIRSVNQYKNILGIYPKGWVLPLVYRRATKENTIYVRLRALHTAADFGIGTPKPPSPKKPIPKRRPNRRPIPIPSKRPAAQSLPQPNPKRRPKGKPIPIRGKRPAPKVPAKYKDMYVKRDGFANYYFNKLEQDRTLRAVKSLGDFSQVGGEWNLYGKTDAGKPFKLIVDDKKVGLVVGDNESYLQFLAQKYEDTPKRTGGFLAAMHVLKLFLTQGRAGTAFPEFYYLGTEPLDGDGAPVDVIVTKYVNSKFFGYYSRWFFDPKDGRLLGFDTALDKDVDECQVRFGAFKDFGGRKLPGTLTVRFAGRTWGVLTLEKAELGAGAVKKIPQPKKAQKKSAKAA
jgi:serine protease Do